ncbi:hypothetical protein [Solibacillus sp. FSL H8-0538]
MLKVLKAIDDFFFKIDDETEVDDKKWFYVPMISMLVIVVLTFCFKALA